MIHLEEETSNTAELGNNTNEPDIDKTENQQPVRPFPVLNTAISAEPKSQKTIIVLLQETTATEEDNGMSERDITPMVAPNSHESPNVDRGEGDTLVRANQVGEESHSLAINMESNDASALETYCFLEKQNPPSMEESIPSEAPSVMQSVVVASTIGILAANETLNEVTVSSIEQSAGTEEHWSIEADQEHPSPFAMTSMPRSPSQKDAAFLDAVSQTSRLVQPVEASPPTPTLEDATATITINTLAQLEDDKAILRSFLDRAAASKENRAVASGTDNANCHRRESLQNRRDSDVVRQALASPRQPLEDKDGNTFSPRRFLQNEILDSPLLQKSTGLENVAVTRLDADRILPPIDDLLPKPEDKSSPRRSSRSRASRLLAGPRQIAVRRNDGNDTVNLTKTEAQLVVQETKRNTRKNKGPALTVSDRLIKWRADIAVHGNSPSPEPKERTVTKGVRWSTTLQFLNEATGKSEEGPLLDNASAPKSAIILLPAPESKAGEGETSRPRRAARTATTRVRRVRALGGAGNGTPAKNVLAATILLDELGEDDTITLPAGGGMALTPVARNKSRIQPPGSLSLNPSVKSVSTPAPAPSSIPTLPSVISITNITAATIPPLTSTPLGQEETKIPAPQAKRASRKSVSLLPVAGTIGATRKGARRGAII
jgi:hypothetical protein